MIYALFSLYWFDFYEWRFAPIGFSDYTVETQAGGRRATLSARTPQA